MRTRLRTLMAVVGLVAVAIGAGVEYFARMPLRSARSSLIEHHERHARLWAELATLDDPQRHWSRPLRADFRRMGIACSRRAEQLRHLDRFDPADERARDVKLEASESRLVESMKERVFETTTRDVTPNLDLPPSW